jgi:hypothetical protein
MYTCISISISRAEAEEFRTKYRLHITGNLQYAYLNVRQKTKIKPPSLIKRGTGLLLAEKKMTLSPGLLI